MSESGFGTAPFGTNQNGLGEPADPGSVPDGYSTGCRYVDPITGEYALDSVTGHLKQVSATMQRVLALIRIRYGSALAARFMGVRAPQKMGSTYDREVDAELRRVLKPLTDRRVIRIDSITVTKGNAGRAAWDLSFTTLATGTPERIEFTR